MRPAPDSPFPLAKKTYETMSITRMQPLSVAGALVYFVFVAGGVIPDGANAAEPELAQQWVFQTQSRIYSSPVVADLDDRPGQEILIVASAERKLICLSAAGEPIWTYEDFVRRNTMTPTVADLDGDGHLEILIGSREKGTVCLTHDGKLRWRVPVEGGLSWTTIVVADADTDDTPEVYWISRLGLVECRRPNGDEAWNYQLGYANDRMKTDSSPAIGDVDGDGQSEIVAASPFQIVCLKPDGKPLWEHKSVSRFNSGPVIANVLGDDNREVLIQSEKGVVSCLDGPTGKILWTHHTLPVRIDASIAVGDFDGNGKPEIFYGDNVGNAFCLDGSGVEQWSYDTGWWIESAPAIGDVDADGETELVFGAEDGTLYCLSATGRLKWTYRTGRRISASPTLCDCNNDGVLDILVGSHNGKLYCLTTKAPWNPNRILWPSKRYNLQQTACVP
jgi:outer membrane protein assembly factor BamB